jgi:F-type H+-transporting ATPase subunit alpha
MMRQTKDGEDTVLQDAFEETLEALSRLVDREKPSLRAREVGTVVRVGEAVARVRGLPGVKSEEIIRFPGRKLGMAFNLDPEGVDVVLLDESEGVRAGQRVSRTGRVVDVPVGEALLGRIIDPLGRPLDGRDPPATADRKPVEREAPAIMERSPVTVPLQTGIQAIDALIPIGRGQRELILGDRATGKTAIAVDTMINQKNREIVCVYCAVGQRSSSVARVVADLRNHGVMGRCIVVAAMGQDTPGLNHIAPYSAMTIAESFMLQGGDALVVIDDLTRHARSYRELSLLLRRPPAREAYPGDIFYIHSRLLERSTHLREDQGGGSLTCLPIIETQAQNISAYIPTNLISITDGQIYLSPKMFREGVLPAVDVGRSVSRVGGKTQLPAYRSVAGDLRLSYSQFEELETFSRFGVRLDEDTQRALERGRRVREVLKQAQYRPIPVAEQLAILLAVSGGLFDQLPVDMVDEAKRRIREAMREEQAELGRELSLGKGIEEEDQKTLLDMASEAIRPLLDEG